MVSFWKGIKKENTSRLPLPSKVDNCVGEEEISNMWQIHYQSLLNSVESTQHKASVKLETTNILNTSKISFTPIDISNAFKSLKLGKAYGVNGVSAEHFLHAHNVLHVLLSLLFRSFITHGYLPPDFMKTALVPIIKNKTGDTSDKNNYMPIALVTAASKIFYFFYFRIIRNVLDYTWSSVWIQKQTLNRHVYIYCEEHYKVLYQAK